jgi:hypothetical protein
MSFANAVQLSPSNLQSNDTTNNEEDESKSYANAGFSLIKENSILTKSGSLITKKFTIMNYKNLFNLIYCYRARTEAVFKNKEPHIFDFFVVDDNKFEQFYLFQNLWRETLLLDHLKDDPRVSKVIDFGLLPNKIIFREVQEMQGITLEDYINSHIE